MCENTWKPAGMVGYHKIVRNSCNRPCEGSCGPNMDSSESVVENTLKAFDRKCAVAYPGRLRVQVEILLSRTISKGSCASLHYQTVHPACGGAVILRLDRIVKSLGA
jgi:hypothetical protein